MKFISAIGVSLQNGERLESEWQCSQNEQTPAIVLEKTKEILDIMTFFIQLFLVKTLGRSVLFGGNNTSGSPFMDIGHDGIRILPFVCEERSIRLVLE